MRFTPIVGPFALLTLVLFGPGQSQGRQEKETKLTGLEKGSQKFVRLLEKGEFKKATADFDDTMKEKLPADKLEETWKGLIEKVGPFKKQTSTRTEKFQQYDIVYVTCEFEKYTLEAKVVYNADKKIAGLFFAPKANADRE
jgi:uncharacterized protein